MESGIFRGMFDKIVATFNGGAKRAGGRIPPGRFRGLVQFTRPFFFTTTSCTLTTFLLSLEPVVNKR